MNALLRSHSFHVVGIPTAGREFNVHMSKGLADRTAVLVASSARAAVGLATKINLFNRGSGNLSAQSVKRGVVPSAPRGTLRRSCAKRLR